MSIANMRINYYLASEVGIRRFGVVQSQGSATGEFGHIINKDWADVLPLSTLGNVSGGANRRRHTELKDEFTLVEILGRTPTTISGTLSSILLDCKFLKLRQVNWDAVPGLVSLPSDLSHLELFACSFGSTRARPIRVPSIGIWLCDADGGQGDPSLACDTLSIRLPCAPQVLSKFDGFQQRIFVEGAFNWLVPEIVKGLRLTEGGSFYAHQVKIDSFALLCVLRQKLRSVTFEETIFAGNLNDKLPVNDSLRELRLDVANMCEDDFGAIVAACPSLAVVRLPRMSLTNRTMATLAQLRHLDTVDMRNLENASLSGSPVMEKVRIVILAKELNLKTGQVMKVFPRASIATDFPAMT